MERLVGILAAAVVALASVAAAADEHKKPEPAPHAGTRPVQPVQPPRKMPVPARAPAVAPKSTVGSATSGAGAGAKAPAQPKGDTPPAK
jgi:hypothetical protein